ncbi:MAG: DUF1059 domain-containing protein, partial [Pseudomonas sp.]
MALTSGVVGRDGRSFQMYEFNCGHQECSSQVRSSNKDDLMRQVAEHVK